MNERIKELIKQHRVDITIDGMGYGEGHIEGLAEAIVQECARIAYDNDIAKFTRDGYRIGLDIQKHFGVEE